MPNAAMAAAPTEWQPTRPIRMINLFVAGGSTDAVARMVAQHMSEPLGQTVVVDNRPGAGGMVGAELAAHATPDGHTIVLVSNAITVYRLIHPKLAFDPLKVLVPVSLVVSSPLVLCSSPALPASSGSELIALARSKPGQLNYGSAGISTNSHLAGELFSSMAKLDMTHVPYKGSAAAITDLISGRIQIVISNSVTMVPLVKTGRLRGLGVTSAKRLSVLPDVPAITEFLPGYELSPWFGLLAPAGTPQPAIARLSQEVRRASERPDVQHFFQRQGATPAYNTPSEFARFIKTEATKWQALVKRVGVRAN